MSKLLHIVATPREDESRTLMVTEAFMDAFRPSHPDWRVDELNLFKEELPSLALKRADGRYILLEGGDIFGPLKETWDEIVGHIERFLSADAYLISTPMWNFSIPYALKQYIDIIVQPKYMFRYTKEGVKGNASGRKMLVITSRGGSYTDEVDRPWDHQEPYMRAIFGFIGITDIEFVIAQPMDGVDEEYRQRILDEAMARARELGEKF